MNQPCLTLCSISCSWWYHFFLPVEWLPCVRWRSSMPRSSRGTYSGQLCFPVAWSCSSKVARLASIVSLTGFHGLWSLCWQWHLFSQKQWDSNHSSSRKHLYLQNWHLLPSCSNSCSMSACSTSTTVGSSMEHLAISRSFSCSKVWKPWSMTKRRQPHKLTQKIQSFPQF